jgi:hypothetical protein
MRDLPQASHLLLPTNVCPLQSGHATVSVFPHPAQARSPRAIVLRHFGQLNPYGFLVAHLGQTRLSLSINSPH